MTGNAGVEGKTVQIGIISINVIVAASGDHVAVNAVVQAVLVGSGTCSTIEIDAVIAAVDMVADDFNTVAHASAHKIDTILSAGCGRIQVDITIFDLDVTGLTIHINTVGAGLGIYNQMGETIVGGIADADDGGTAREHHIARLTGSGS